MKIWKRIPKRFKRVASFGLGAGIAGLGAGNIWNLSALESAGFGATLAIIGLIGALSFSYAGKGDVPDSDFDAAINDAIQAVNSKAKNPK